MRELNGLRVCFIAGTLGQGGAERQLYYILGALHQSGAIVELLSLSRGEFWEGKIRELGVPVTWVGQQASKLARLTRMVSVLRSRRPNVLQSQHFYTNLYACGVAHTLRTREIGALRSDVINETRDGNQILGRLSLVAPRQMIANSTMAITNAVRLGAQARRLHLLPNVVDTHHFRPSKRLGNRPVTLLAVGRLGPEKRFDRLLSALGALRRRASTPFRAVIVGDGPERLALERQAEDLQLLPDFVEFRGSVPDIAPVYREADLLVLTSDWEGTPNVLLEAMASGLPVVSTRVGGVPEVVDEGKTGYIVTRDDHGELQDALGRLIKDQALRNDMGARGRACVLDRHSPQQLPARLAAIYDEVLS